MGVNLNLHTQENYVKNFSTCQLFSELSNFNKAGSGKLFQTEKDIRNIELWISGDNF